MPKLPTAYAIPRTLAPRAGRSFGDADYRAVVQHPDVVHDQETRSDLRAFAGERGEPIPVRLKWAIPNDVDTLLALIVTPELAAQLPQAWFNRELSLPINITGQPEYYRALLLVCKGR